MSELSPRLGMPYLQPSQAQKHVTHNEALQRLDVVTQLCLQSAEDTVPPTAPGVGDIHGIGANASGAWAGRDGQLAIWLTEGWFFLPPQEGWRAWVLDSQTFSVWREGAWQPVLGELSSLGIGTSADSTNRLAIASEASLFTHDGNDHRMVLNKAGAADTGALLFQSGWTGHAELGLMGETAFAVKVSADGQTWDTVLHADPNTQEIAFAPAGQARLVLGDTGLQLDVPLSGSAVQNSSTDATPGRVMTTGAFGLGGETSPFISDFSAALTPGFYRYLEDGSLGAPGSGAAHVGDVIVTRPSQADTRTNMIAARGTDQARSLWSGYRSSTGDVSWDEIYTQASVLGVVSETNGRPTGAMIEQGNNSNGDYVRFADGTQICWHVVVTSTSGVRTWVYPASWSGAKRVYVTPNGVSGPCVAAVQGVFSNSCQVSAWNLSGNRVSESVAVMAIGRWFD